jgi:hypothetical protein
MQLSSTAKAAIDRDSRQYLQATGENFSTFIQEQILDSLETGPVGITADAADIDSVAKGGGAFTYDVDGSSGTTFAYLAGRLHNGYSAVNVSAGSVALASSSTNYVEVDRAGTVTSNTTAFTAGRLPLFVVVTGSTDISTVTSAKPLLTLLGPNSVNGAMGSTPVQTKEVSLQVGTIATSAGSTKFCVVVPTTVAAASKITKARLASAAALATSDTNYVAIGVVNKGAAGAGTQVLADVTAAANKTTATGGSAIAAYTPRDLTLVTISGGAERDVTGGDVLEITFTVTGTLAGALTQVTVLLEFSFTN